jgi:hypothetical protein
MKRREFMHDAQWRAISVAPHGRRAQQAHTLSDR